MTHEYQVKGMTCEACVAKVTSLIEKTPGVTGASISRDGTAQISMDRHLSLAELQAALRAHPQYQLLEKTAPTPARIAEETTDERGFWATYRPVFWVFGYILGVTLLVEWAADHADPMRWMRHFMAGFFLVFSFFKLLDVPAFAASYSSYDIAAKRWITWGYIYPFIELTLGVLFLIDFNPLLTNTLTLAVMSLSIIGVVQSLLAKRRFQCACLGAVFNLPMSSITLIEDALMIAMSGGMLIGLLLF